MDTSQVDEAIEKAVSDAGQNPVRVEPVKIDGLQPGISATVQTNVYSVPVNGISISGVHVIGTILFPNGYRATRIIDLGPNQHLSTDWPSSIEEEMSAHSSRRADLALCLIGSKFSQAEQTALLFKWSSVVASGSQNKFPKLSAVENWIAAISRAALTGEIFPAAPKISFVELMQEAGS